MRRIAALAAIVAVTLPAFGGSASAASVTPLDAGRVADGIGVNTHLTYTRSSYANPTAVRAALRYLGVTRVRDVLLPDDDGRFNDHYNAILRYLADHDGVRFMLQQPRPSTLVTDPAALAATAATTLRGAVDAIEGVNEYDLSRVSDWPARLLGLQSDLFAAVRARPELAGVPVVAPAMGHTDSWAAPDVSAFVDAANIHPFPGAHRPGDWTSLPAHERLRAAVQGTGTPLIASELGYHTAIDDPTTFAPVSERAKAAYLPQLLLTGAARGLTRQYVYQLADEVDEPAGREREQHFGLFDAHFQPKPSAVALARLIDVLGDASHPAPAGGLDYGVSGPADITSALLRRADGTFLVALWRDKDLWDARTRTDVDPGDARVTVRLDGVTADAAVQHLLGDAAPVAAGAHVSTVDVVVPAADTTILLLRPTGTSEGAPGGLPAAATVTRDATVPAPPPGAPAPALPTPVGPSAPTVGPVPPRAAPGRAKTTVVQVSRAAAAKARATAAKARAARETALKARKARATARAAAQARRAAARR